MKTKLQFALSAVAALLLAGQNSFAQTPSKSGVAKDLQAVSMKVQTKMKDARTEQKKLTEADLTEEIKTLDDLIAKSKSSAPDDAAQAMQLKATLYGSVLGDQEKAGKLKEQLKTEFANTKLVEAMKKGEERQAAAKKIQDSLSVGSTFPDFDKKDLNGKPLSIANFKGKVVLIDFWATWCPPCRAEVPNVVAVYNKYHSKGFEIIGISLDREADKGKLESYTKENKMPWQQFFDGKYWQNELSTKYGVNSIPATYLLDGQGKIIAKNLRGEDLEQAVAKALGKS